MSPFPPPLVLQQPPPPAGGLQVSSPVPEPRLGRLVPGTCPCWGTSSSSSGHNPCFPLAGGEGKAHSSRPSFPTHFSSAVKKLALLPIQKGTRLPLRVSVSGVPSRCESTAVHFLLREAPQPAFLPPRSRGGRDAATSAAAAAAAAAATAQLSPSCVEEEPRPPPCGQAGGGGEEGEGRRASGGGAEQPS